MSEHNISECCDERGGKQAQRKERLVHDCQILWINPKHGGLPLGVYSPQIIPRSSYFKGKGSICIAVNTRKGEYQSIQIEKLICSHMVQYELISATVSLIYDVWGALIWRISLLTKHAHSC